MPNCPEYKRKCRDRQYRKKYGITLVQHKEILAAQGYECPLCGVELSSHGTHTHVDHCHESGKIRAILCTNCNRGLGHFHDNVSVLQAAIDYLNHHNVSCNKSSQGGTTL